MSVMIGLPADVVAEASGTATPGATPTEASASAMLPRCAETRTPAIVPPAVLRKPRRSNCRRSGCSGDTHPPPSVVAASAPGPRWAVPGSGHHGPGGDLLIRRPEARGSRLEVIPPGDVNVHTGRCNRKSTYPSRPEQDRRFPQIQGGSQLEDGR